MTLLQTPTAPAPAPRARVAELQARINGMQTSAPPTRAVPTRADLALLLPGGFREGAVYQLRGSTTLASIALAEASAAGRWTAWVGWPGVAAEALAVAGLRLDRTVLVPEPGAHWVSVLSSLADAMSLIAVRPPRAARLSPGDTARIAARLRDRGCTLLVDADWPGADAELRVDARQWQGLGRGIGLILERQLQVSVRDRAGRVRRGPVGVNAPLARTLQAVPAAPPQTASELGEVNWAVSA